MKSDHETKEAEEKRNKIVYKKWMESLKASYNNVFTLKKSELYTCP